MKTPSESLADRIVDRLVEAGLIRQANKEQIAAKIAAGELKGEDWKLEIDLAKTKVGS